MDFNSKAWKIGKLVAIVAAIAIGVWFVMDNFSSLLGWVLTGGGGFEAGRELHKRQIDKITREAKADNMSTKELLERLDNTRGSSLISLSTDIFKKRN